MTGRTLYDRHCRALKKTERKRYDNDLHSYVRVWPTKAPVAWDFVNDDMRRYYNELARLLTPRRRKSSTPQTSS